jgi:hypothetical protein
MSRTLLCAVVVGVVTGFAASGGAQAPVTPAGQAAVEAAFKKTYPNATMKSVKKETLDGRAVYEVESVDNGRDRNVIYNPDGSVVTIEDVMTEAEFPAAVTAAIVKRYPKATITVREKLTITQGAVVHYEAELTGAGAVKEVVLTVDGQWVSPK